MNDPHIEQMQKEEWKLERIETILHFEKQPPPDDCEWGTAQQRHDEKIIQRQEWRKDRKKGRR